MKHIPEDIKKQILKKATLHNVLQHYHGFHKKKGVNHVMDCPKCNKKDKLEYNEKKGIAKCFSSCDLGVRTPVNYLMKFQGLTYGQALHELARIENIHIPNGEERKRRSSESKTTYLQQFLRGSGLDIGDVTDSVYVDEDTRKEKKLYESATVDGKFQIVPGDDVVIHYYDLYGKPMTYYKKDRKGNAVGAKLNFYRVRYQNPNLHLDKNQDPVKYRSPYGSETKIYINKWVREKFKKNSKIKTLYVQEGEKKADKATKHGLISVGIMGIHNIAYNKRLPMEFEAIIKSCQVENVVFVLDSDWDRLSSKIDSTHTADQRPKSFYRAVINFRDHFYAFTNNDIHLNIYFGYVKENIENDKGIDDLMVNTLRNKEDELKVLCEEALTRPDGDAKYLEFHRITTMGEHKIKEFWNLQNKDAFIEQYAEVLKALPKFRYGKVEWRFDENGEVVLAQPVLPDEMFWTENVRYDKDGKYKGTDVTFNYKRCYTFLQNRGFYRLPQPGNSFIWIQTKDNLVWEVEPFQIKDFVVEFAEQLNKEEVENMLYKGGRMYLGPESMGNLKNTALTLHQPSKNTQYLYFNDCYFKVTDEDIELQEIKNLNGQVWKDNIKDFTPIKTELLISEVHQVGPEDVKEHADLQHHIGEYLLDFSEAGQNCHFLRFLLNTSTYFGKTKSFEDVSFSDKFETTRHLMSKITAFGYMLHRYRNPATMKAIIGMDGTMSEVGQSNGRSGKSLFGIALEHMAPTITIPGKKRDLLDDKYLFEEVDQRTSTVFFDDVRTNFDFEFLFPYITGKFTVEKKGVGKTTLPPEYVIKFYIATNHAINGEGSSFEDRQFVLGFSDWYNSNYKPTDDFQVMFFDEWDEKQWNLFYNFAAMALHFYFKYGLIEAPNEKLHRRKLRQQISESFLDWADEYFSNPLNCNSSVKKDVMYQAARGDTDHVQHGDGFLTKFPGQRRYCTIQKFKHKIKMYCEYRGYEFNPRNHGGDIKTGGKEYFEVYLPEEQYAELQEEHAKSTEQNKFPL
ncbi:CHC2 zinc finger domain-containing protein [Muricauda sp. SCSIO 64092]|uniref:CHC2 zinc finger domain-containing protein n=1 Tax=Allomuricauda sp. SCSIO 64092 TaxID=2908842 RepID=UPI001FF3BA9B|nr:CHC2 zinc finger domain-containing protein [Muricauda sp. SCSIO 64092]UOY07745.1 CHC2 zinc finger domain-containing protein [Muricauda sp. SCSIO 64092]